jgi:methylmalonyl-CoA carboxyltransferase small subunit
LKLRITIDGTTYEADVEVVDEEEELDEAADHVYAEPVYTPPENEGSDRECRSPVMGLVIRVEVRAGEKVEAGQRVLVLEAMKMETHLTVKRSCSVKKVHVATGDSVKIGQLLVEFE